jgi:hypothetical protein
MTVSSCRHDPVPAFTPVLTAMPGNGIPLGDVLSDSGYSHRIPQNWASPLRAAGAQLVQDLHPHDRGPKGIHAGAVIANGGLYCPRTPRPLLQLGPLSRAATPEQAAQHDAKTAEAARYKLGRLTADDQDGYHRVQCPAAAGKIRCPLQPPSMTLDRDRPEILAPPEHPQACCTQQTVTVPPDVNAKSAQKHDYPSAAWRRSYARRSAAERSFATAKDPGCQRHRPRLVPSHGPDTADAVHRMPASRPQPAHPGSLECPAGRKPAARRQRPPTENPQTPPQNPHRAHGRAALTLAGSPPAPTPPARTQTPRQREHARTPKNHARNSKKAASGALPASPPQARSPSRPECQTQT